MSSEFLQKEVQFIDHMMKAEKNGDLKDTLKSVLVCDYFAWIYGPTGPIICPMFELGVDFIDYFHADIKPIVKFYPEYVKSTVIEIIRCIINGLYAFHTSGIFHRDIKPENIIYFPKKTGLERYKICDFGLSSFLSKEGTDVGIRGTRDFFPPEFDEDSKYYSMKYRGDIADIWAAGRTIMTIIGEAENSKLKLTQPIASMYCNEPSKRPTSRKLYETYIVKQKSIFI
jgi:serine/threonine protein kinase